jgi:predicted anti-sigma-YlaC factor YlaD
MSNDLTCAELVEQVTDLLENALADDARQRFVEHLRHCEGCTDYVQQFEEIVRALGHLTPEPADVLSNDVQRNLLASFRRGR